MAFTASNMATWRIAISRALTAGGSCFSIWMAWAFAFQSEIGSARTGPTKSASPSVVILRMPKTLLLFIASSIVSDGRDTAQPQAYPPKLWSKIIYLPIFGVLVRRWASCAASEAAFGTTRGSSKKVYVNCRVRSCVSQLSWIKYEVVHTSRLLQVVGHETMPCIDSCPAVTSAIGASRTWRDVRRESALALYHPIADARRECART